MTQQWPSAFSTSVALQLSHEALSAELLAFYCKHSQQRGYKEERPSGLHQFFSFCLVRPAGGCAPSSSWCSNSDSKQRLGKWARLKYYPQTHTFIGTVMGGFDAPPLTCEAASVTLTPFYLFSSHCVLKSLKKKKKNLKCLYQLKSSASGISHQVNGGHGGGVRPFLKQMFTIPATAHYSLSEQQWGSNGLIVLFMMRRCTFQMPWFYNTL